VVNEELDQEYTCGDACGDGDSSCDGDDGTSNVYGSIDVVSELAGICAYQS